MCRQKSCPSSRSQSSSQLREERLSPAKNTRMRPFPRSPSSASAACAARQALAVPSTTSVSPAARIAFSAVRTAWSIRAVSASDWPSQPRYCAKPGWLLRRCRCASKSSFSRLRRSGSDTQLQIFDNSTFNIKAPSSAAGSRMLRNTARAHSRGRSAHRCTQGPAPRAGRAAARRNGCTQNCAC